MKKFSAHLIFPISSPPIAKGIIKVDNSGLIMEVVNPGNTFKEEAGLEFHNGIICPSFVNLLGEFPVSRFFKLFPELEKHKSGFPSNKNSEKAILEWMKQIQSSGSRLSLERLIRLFTFDSAKAIELNNEMGSIAPGKRPGLLLISGIDFQNMKLSPHSSLKRLI